MSVLTGRSVTVTVTDRDLVIALRLECETDQDGRLTGDYWETFYDPSVEQSIILFPNSGRGELHSYQHGPLYYRWLMQIADDQARVRPTAV